MSFRAKRGIFERFFVAVAPQNDSIIIFRFHRTHVYLSLIEFSAKANMIFDAMQSIAMPAAMEMTAYTRGFISALMFTAISIPMKTTAMRA